MKFAKSYEPGAVEPEIYAGWEAGGVFLPREEKKWASAYSIVMPPPNANGNLHVGHGLTIALQDVLTRYHRLRGLATWYIPGADHAGFETWVVYERALEEQGKSRFDYGRDELYHQVHNFVMQQKGNMELQVRALGASCDFSSSTFTLDEKVVKRTYQTFKRMLDEGLIYRGEKLVNYCTKHQTAFADIEVVHEDEKGYLWEIAYPYEGGEIVVSTTRPETMLGDVAVAVNPADERYQHLVGKMVRLPLAEREIPVVFDEHAEMEYGTGAVKITPAHDFDDFEVGERHDLPRINVIGYDGKMLPSAGNYAGMTVAECRKQVLKDLEKMGLLRGRKEITHAVAKCYKCGTVIEPLLMKQWFIDTEKLAKLAIERLEAGEIKFYPENKGRVLVNYLRGLKDWNISRQIPWGIAIPMFRRKRDDDSDAALLRHAPGRSGQVLMVAKAPHAEPESSSKYAEAPEWVFDPRTELAEIEIDGVVYERDPDTFDTWFSSAHWPMVCTNWTEGVENPFYPLDVMETGADILFAWVARMIMMGVYVTGAVPFREVYLHGLVLDERGQKMSKSKGNVVNPMEMVMKYGSDAFRVGILKGRSAGLAQAFSENSVVMGRNLCNKLWNISRLVQDMVEKREQEQEIGVAVAELRQGFETKQMGEDWICREINEARGQLEKMIDEYRFAEAVEVVYDLIWNKYADWFLESQKIYRNEALLTATLEQVLILAHPVLPFLTEAIWQNLSWTEGMIAVAKWPSGLKYDPISAEKFESLMGVVAEIRRAMTGLSETLGGKKCGVLFGEDALIDDNSLLVQFLTRASFVRSAEGQPRGMRLPMVNREVYIDVAPEVVAKYRAGLEERILAVGREADVLRARMMNPRYVERAPAELVAETRAQLAEKEELIEKIKLQMQAIN